MTDTKLIKSISFGLGDGQITTTDGYFEIDDLTIGASTSVPEPSTLAIFALAMMGIASRRFNK